MDRQKAEFILNFAKFSYWPRSRLLAEDGRFTLCQLGGSARLARALAALEAQTVRGHRITFRRIENAAQASDCMLLFTSGRPPPLHTSDAVLTVGNGIGFAQQGGMIGLLQDGAQLKFEVNLAALQRADILMSSQVLSLASNVIEASMLTASGRQSRFLPASTFAPDPVLEPLPALPAVQPTDRGR